MSAHQVATNAAATRWLADLLERWGVTTDPQQRAEYVTRELLSQGLAPIPTPVPLRPPTPAATEEQRRAHLQRAQEALAARRNRQEHTR